jgi:DNA-binding transcriptional LysR family regulator
LLRKELREITTGRALWTMLLFLCPLVGYHIVGHAARLGATLNIRARVTTFDAVCGMVEVGAGVGIVPEATAKRWRRSMKVDSTRLRDPWAKRNLVICVRRLSSLPTGAQGLLEHLRQAAA